MKLIIKKYSSNILGMYKICDEKGYIQYHVVHESVGKLRLYEGDKELGCVKHKSNNLEDIYEFCLHRKYLGKLVKQPTLKKTKYTLFFENALPTIVHVSMSDYRVLDANDESIMIFSQEPSFESKQYLLDITDDNNEHVCILIALSLIMAG